MKVVIHDDDVVALTESVMRGELLDITPIKGKTKPGAQRCNVTAGGVSVPGLVYPTPGDVGSVVFQTTNGAVIGELGALYG